MKKAKVTFWLVAFIFIFLGNNWAQDNIKISDKGKSEREFTEFEPAKWTPQYGEKGELLNPKPSVRLFAEKPHYPQILSETQILFEDFSDPQDWDGSNPPTGWAIYDNGDENPSVWNNNDWHAYYYSSWGDTVARVYYLPSEQQDEWLVSPVMDFAGSDTLYNQILLKFKQYYNDDAASNSDSGFVRVYNGVMWNTATIYQGVDYGSSTSPDYQSIDITSLAEGNSNVKVAFKYVGNSDYYWYVDSVEVVGLDLAEYDVAKTTINSPTVAVEGYNLDIITTVYNNGTAAATFDDSTYIYPIVKNIVFSENFESDWGPHGDNPPAGWSIVDYGDEDPPVWNNNDWYKYYYSSFGSNCARVYYYPAENQDEWLISPSINLTSVSNTWLRFRTYYNNYYDDTAFVFGTTNDWITTDTIAVWNADIPRSYVDFDISSWADGQTNVKIAFRYVGNDAYGWRIDDVEVFYFTYPPPTYISGQTVTNLASLESRDVTYDSTWSVPSPNDYEYIVTSFTALSGDTINSNDTISTTILGYSHFGSGGPDSGDYYWEDNITGSGSTFNWYDISATGSNVVFVYPTTESDDRYSAGIDMGFSFFYYGNTYSRIFVDENGYASFDSINTTTTTNYSIPSTSGMENLLALLWDDLDAYNDTVGYTYYQTVDYDSDGDDEFIIQYDNYSYYSSSLTSTIQMQMIIDPTGFGSIKYQYNQHGPDISISNTIGIEDSTGTIGLLYIYNGNPFGNLALPGLAITFYCNPQITDVGVSSILSPPDSIYTSYSYPLTSIVTNYGTTEQTFNVIFEVYVQDSTIAEISDTFTVTSMPSLSVDTITFSDSLIPMIDTTYELISYTILTVDDDNSNDTTVTTVHSIIPPGMINGTVTDTSGTAIESVLVTVDEGTRLLSTDEKSFNSNILLSVGSIYTDENGYYEVEVPPAEYNVTFQHSSYRDSTVSGVTVTQEDTTTVNIELNPITDVSVTSILSPPDSIYTSFSYPLTSIVTNYGITEQSFDVVFEVYIQDSTIAEISDTFTISSMPGQSIDTITFSDSLIPTIDTTYELISYTILAGDEDNNNDTTMAMVFSIVPPCDVGVSGILSPPDSIYTSYSYPLTSAVTNYGMTEQTFDVIFQVYIQDSTIAEVSDTFTVSSMPGQSVYAITFSDSLIPTIDTTYELISYTILAGDDDNSNDTTVTTVQSIIPPGMINGTVTDTSGAAIESVLVTIDEGARLLSADGKAYNPVNFRNEKNKLGIAIGSNGGNNPPVLLSVGSIYTDENGYYEVEVPPAEYNVTFQHSSYRDSTVSGVTVTQEDTTTVNIELYPIWDCNQNPPDNITGGGSESEPNDIYSSANEAQCEYAYCGNITDSTDVDWWYLDIPDDGNWHCLEIKVYADDTPNQYAYGSGCDPYVRLYDSDCSTVVYANDNYFFGTFPDAVKYDSQINFETNSFSPGSRVYIKIETIWNSPGPYLFVISCDTCIEIIPPVNDLCENAISIGPSYPAIGTGTCFGATVDCPDLTRDWNAVWYSIELPYDYNNISINICSQNGYLAGGGGILMNDCNCDDYLLYESGLYLDSSQCNTGYDGAELKFFQIPRGDSGKIYWPAFLRDSSYIGLDFSYEVNVTEWLDVTFSTVPVQNEVNVSKNTNISATFNQDINGTTINDSTFVVYAKSTGPHSGVIDYDSLTRTATFNPDNDFANGEEVTVVLTTNIQSSQGIPLENSFIWSFTIVVEGGSGTFEPPINLTVGSGPALLSVANFNGDNYLDIATGNINSNNVSILLNNGDSTFTSHDDYDVIIYPYSVCAADLDGDNDCDVAAANRWVGIISIIFNNGDGSFVSDSSDSYQVGTNPLCVYPADLDGDGDIDLVTANDGSDNVSILFNYGDGTFASHITYSVGEVPYSVIASDLDNDGDLDLAVANHQSDNISVLMNLGDASFIPDAIYSTGDGPHTIYAADLNNDNFIDLVTANAWSDDVSVLLNNGEGVFSSYTSYSCDDNSICVFAADLDGDEDLDLATANYQAANVSILLNHGNGTFASQVTYSVGTNPRSVFAADIDNDGGLDLVVGNENSNSVSILLNTYIGYGTISGLVTDTLSNPIENVIVTDLNSGLKDTTDVIGGYVLDSVLIGLHDIDFYHPDYPVYVASDVNILENDTTTLNVVLGYPSLSEDVALWFGNIDNSPINALIGDRVNIDVYAMTSNTVFVGDVVVPLGIAEQYFDSLLSQAEGQFYYPFTQWGIAFFYPPESTVPESIVTECFYGVSRYISPDNPLFHSEIPTKILTFKLKVKNDSLIVGDTIQCLYQGYHSIMGGPKAGDSSGTTNYSIDDFYSPLYFIANFGNLAGTVTEQGIVSIEEVNVSIINTTYFDSTDSNGDYFIEDVIPGTYNIFFSHSDYFDTTVSNIQINSDDTTTLDVELVPIPDADVGVSDIINPFDSVYVNQPYEVITEVTNFGLQSQTFDVVFDIYLSGSSSVEFTDTFLVTSMPGQSVDTITFSDSFVPLADTFYNIIAFTTLVTDEKNSNDTSSIFIDANILGVITGIVSDTATVPIQNVYVNIDSLAVSDSTDTGGEYILDNLIPGNYDVSFSHVDYFDSVITNVTINLNETTYVDMILLGEGSLSGIVTDTLLNPINNIIVTDLNHGSFVATDSLGGYLLTGLVAGIHDIEFSHFMYQDTVVGEVNIVENDTISLDVTLYPPYEPGVNLWFGGEFSGSVWQDTIAVFPGDAFNVDVWFNCGLNDYIGNCLFNLGVNISYFDSIVQTQCTYNYPFTEWDVKNFTNSQTHNDNHYLSFEGTARTQSPFDNPWLHFSTPTKVLTFVIQSSDDYGLLGQTFCNALSSDQDSIQNANSAIDTLGSSIPINAEYACVYFGLQSGYGIIKGTLTDISSSPIENVHITADDGNRDRAVVEEDWTDSYGRYSLYMPSGMYDLTFSHIDHFDTTYIDYNLSEAVDTLNVELIPQAIDEVVFWFGNIDGSPVIAIIGRRVSIDVYLQTSGSTFGAGIHVPLMADDQYIDTLLSVTEGQFYYPLTEWDVAEFSPPNDSMIPSGWTNQSFLGINYLSLPVHPWLHFEIPTKILTFVARTVNDPLLDGDTVLCLGIGVHPTAESLNVTDTLAGLAYSSFEYLSEMTFIASSSYEYLPGDVGMYYPVWPPAVQGGDVTYLVNFMRQYETNLPCYLNGLWASADINGDCRVMGGDVTALVNVMRSILPAPMWCDEKPSAWPTPDDLPETEPSGWPNCDTPPVTGARVIPVDIGK